MNIANKTSGRIGALLPTAAAALLALAAGPALAVTAVTLCAQPFNKVLPVQAGPNIAVPMWGYSVGSCTPIASDAPSAPVITVPLGETELQVTLINNLTVPTSIVLASQRMPTDGGTPMAPVLATDVTDVAGSTVCGPTSQTCRLRSFTGETAPTATRTYTFSNLRPGTYLYQSGTHPQVQIQMGLAGMARIGAPSTAVAQDVPVVLSEVDVNLHVNIAATLGTAGNQATWQAGGNSTLKYAPTYFLVNGRPFNGVTNIPSNPNNSADTDLVLNRPAGNADHPVRLRIANAGLESRSLVLNSGTWKVIGENGYAYKNGATMTPREQASLLVPAGTTADADVNVHVNNNGVANQRLAFFDRRTGTRNGDSSLAGGLLARIINDPNAPALAAIADQIVNEGATLTLQVLAANVASYAISGGAIIASDGKVTFPVANGTTATTLPLTVTATSANSVSVAQTFNVIVNHRPVAVADGTQAAPTWTITLSKTANGPNGNGLATTPGLTFAASVITGNDTDPDVTPFVPSHVLIDAVTLVEPVNGLGVGLPTVTAPSGNNWSPASATYNSASKSISLKPIIRNADGLVVRNANVSAFGVYKIDYRVTDQGGLASAVAASAYIKVD